MLNALRGRGLREQTLRRIGIGDLYDRLAALETECKQLRMRLAESERVLQVDEADVEVAAQSAAERQECTHLLELKALNRLIAIDFPVRPHVRFGWDLPPHDLIRTRIAQNDAQYRKILATFVPLLPAIATIPAHPVDDTTEPNWINLAFPALDAIALYGQLVINRPRRFLEIGSGFSTKFARRAIKDHALPTKLISIDPEPRADIDSICHEVVRRPLEDTPLDFFSSVTADDFVFIDGSHRCFQGSDATVFFTEILPRLPAGVLIGVHDIFLPADYPPAWLDWYLSEQYLLACWLLGGDRIQIELPMYYIGETPDLHEVLSPFWQHAALAGANHRGGAFFFRLRN